MRFEVLWKRTSAKDRPYAARLSLGLRQSGRDREYRTVSITVGGKAGIRSLSSLKVVAECVEVFC